MGCETTNGKDCSLLVGTIQNTDFTAHQIGRILYQTTFVFKIMEEKEIIHDNIGRFFNVRDQFDLWFGCKVNDKTVYFLPDRNAYNGEVCTDSINISRLIFYCNYEEFQAVKEVYEKYERLIATYYNFCQEDIHNLPYGFDRISQLLSFKLTEEERRKVEKHLASFTFIYLIHDAQTGYTKIGRSNSPESRLRTLIRQDTLLPQANDFSLLLYWRDLPSKELFLHEKFSEKRVRGEWFDLSDEDKETIRIYYTED